MKRDIVFNPDELLLEGLNPYEVLTLISITERTFGGYNLALTKEGGFWPILLTELSLQYDLSEEDVDSALKYAIGEYKKQLTKPKRPSTFPFQLSGPEFSMILNFIYSLPPLAETPKAIPMTNISKLIRVSFKRYNETIVSLVIKRLIEDPFEYLGFLVLGLVPYRFNRETINGRSTSQHIKALFWEMRKSTTINEHGDEVKKEEYYFKLISPMAILDEKLHKDK